MKEDIEQQIIDLNDQVTHLYEQGEYEQAVAIAQQVRQIAERHLPPNHRHVVDSINTLAVLSVANGDYAAAEPLQERALQLYRDILEPDDPTLVVALSNAANVYELKGDYAKAEPLLHEALERTLKIHGESTPDHALCLNNLALFYYRLRQYERARPYFLQAMTIYREEGMEEDSDFANTLDNLAGLYEATGQYEQARPLYEEALQMREKICGKDHPDYASSLNNLAYLYESMKNYSAAEALYQEALQIREDTLGKQHPDVADTLNNLAEVYEAIGNYRQAEPLFQRALAIRQATLGEAHPQVAQSLHNLAGLYAATHRVNEALDEMKIAAAINDGMIGHIFSMSSEEQRMEYLITLRGQFAAFLSLVVQHLSQSPAALQAAFELVLRRKAIGAEALSIQRDAVLEKRYSNLAKKMHTLTQLRAQIARETMDGPLSEGVQAYQQRLRELHTRKNLLEAEIVRQIPKMNLAQKLQSVDRHIVASLLPVNATLVEFVRFPLFNFDALPAQGEFYWGQEYYVAFVLSSQRPDQVQMIKLGEAKSIEEKIVRFRKAITGEDEENPMRVSAPLHPSLTTKASPELSEDKLRHLAAVPGPGDTTTFFPRGQDLRKEIFDPLLPAFNGHTRLFLAPDGDLARLPFEVLPTDDGEHLINDYRISYLSVGRDVLRLGRVSKAPSTAPLVVADPDFDLKAYTASTLEERDARGRQSQDTKQTIQPFRRLPGTRDEGEQIASLLGVTPLLGSRAVETTIKVSRSPQILHVASHGFFLPDQHRLSNRVSDEALKRLSCSQENPLLRSGLALAGANTWLRGDIPPIEAEDGLLTAEDVSGMDLLATELVVLSACGTGLGEVQVGEGVFGLRRSFMLAGARTLIMSLWSVPDRQTKELMVDFYRRISQGEKCAEALREAQRAMQKNTDSSASHWGAFICQGDPDTTFPADLVPGVS